METRQDFIKEELFFTKIDIVIYFITTAVLYIITTILILPACPFIIFEKITSSSIRALEKNKTKKKQLKAELRELNEKSK